MNFTKEQINKILNICAEKKEGEILKLAELYTLFKKTKYFLELLKMITGRKKHIQRYDLYKYFEKNKYENEYRNVYKFHKMIKKKEYYNILIGYKLKQNIDENDENDKVDENDENDKVDENDEKHIENNIENTCIYALNELCEFTDNKKDFVNINNIHNIINSKITKKKVIQYFKDNINTSKYYKYKYRYYIDKKQKETTNVLLCYKLKLP